MENIEKKVPDIVAEAEKIMHDKFLREYGRPATSLTATGLMSISLTATGDKSTGYEAADHAVCRSSVAREVRKQRSHGGVGLNICMVVGCLFFTLVFFG